MDIPEEVEIEKDKQDIPRGGDDSDAVKDAIFTQNLFN